MPTPTPRLLLIDGHSMAFRAFYALPDTMATSTGQVTNAVYGFTSMLVKLLEQEQPTHAAVAFDVSRHSFRTERYPAYKGTRKETPEAFKGQVPLIKEMLAALGIAALEREGYEADDILATLAAQGTAAGMEVLICSGDRDALQLVTGDVTVLYPVKGVSELARMTPEAVITKYGVPPAQYPDLAALVGEASDNLIGVPGVGPKTATKWVTQYGDLAALLAHADEIKGKAGESLRECLDQVRLNRELNALLRDVELPLKPDDFGLRAFDREAVYRLAEALQFGGLRDRIFAVDPGGATVGEATATGGSAIQREVLALKPGELAGWLAACGVGPVGVDVSGRGTPVGADAWAVALAYGEEAVVIDLAGVRADDEAALTTWLANPTAAKTLHGAKAARHALKSRNPEGPALPLAGVTFDTELAAYLCYPDQRGYDLSDLVVRHLGRELYPEEEEATQGAFELDLDNGSSAVGQREAARAGAVLDLVEVLGAQLADRKACLLLTDVELPLSEVLARMEQIGIAADVALLTELERDFAAQVATAASRAYAAIGHEVNLGSPKQLQEVLFGELNMPKTKKTKTGYTTDAAALAELYAKTGHPFLEHLLAHRDAAKLRVIVEGLWKAVQPDKRIHTTFQQTIAATGRLSSAEPNLQNIPIRTEAGRQIRRVFRVGQGFETLLSADYSQIEMRIMAHLSGDAGLIEAFRTGEDLHRYVGSRVFGVDPGEVTAAMRTKVKAMSYGLAYGLSAFGLYQ
ncbi:MAG: DNA polymerase I, partial [Promicromonosporaceae bacterium]|nr:DNA polymerase I [Promicromonosporaceae bacterium]